MLKKRVGVTLLILGFLLFAPQAVDANEDTSLALFEYIDELEEELFQLTSTVSGKVAGESITVPSLNRSLYIGLRDTNSNEDVSQLQRFLKEQGDFDYPEITGYFGPITEQAVKRWQSRNGVVSVGTPSTTGYGVVGPKTRLKIKETATNASEEDVFDFDLDFFEEEELDETVVLSVPPVEEGAPVFLSSRMHHLRDPIRVGDKVVFMWEAEDPEGGNLSWSVDWGDKSGQDSSEIICSSNGDSNPANIAVQKFVAVHSWDKPGVYSVIPSASDCDGHTTIGYDHSFRISVVGEPTSGAHITVKKPNGGESWKRGAKKNILWKSRLITDSASSINIKLYNVSATCLDDEYACQAKPNGLFPIVLGTENDGKYSWNVADTLGEIYLPDGLYKIRVEDAKTGRYDDSNKPFKIYTKDITPVGKISVVYPNGGETLTRHKEVKMSWKNSKRVNVDLLIVPDTRYYNKVIRESYTIAKNLDWSKDDKQGYLWRVGEFIESNSNLRTMPDGAYRFEVCPSEMDTYGDCGISKGSFKISSDQGEGKIEIGNPESGDALKIGLPYKVKWDYSGDISEVDIYLRSGGGPECDSLVCTSVYRPEIRYDVAIGEKNLGYFEMIAGVTMDTRTLPPGQYDLEVCDSSSHEVCDLVPIFLTLLSDQAASSAKP